MPQLSIFVDSEEEWRGGHGWNWRWIMNLIDERTREQLGFSVFPDWEGDRYRIPDMAREREHLPF